MSDTLEAIQSRADKATPGPWANYGDLTHEVYPKNANEDDEPDNIAFEVPRLADAEFIANARTDIPALLAIVREQAATIAAVRDLANSAGRCGWRVSADDIRKTLGKP